MTTTVTMTGNDFLSALSAPGRALEIPESADAYGWLIGSWELEILRYRVDLRGKGVKGEVHFGWVLEGRAVQDVWIMPPRNQRTGHPDVGMDMYGTTIRVWDAALQAWRVTWINPISGQCDRLVGRRQGNEIVQVGTHADGTPIRWTFTDISPDSYLWLGEVLNADGKTWSLEGEFRARRIC